MAALRRSPPLRSLGRRREERRCGDLPRPLSGLRRYLWACAGKRAHCVPGQGGALAEPSCSDSNAARRKSTLSREDSGRSRPPHDRGPSRWAAAPALHDGARPGSLSPRRRLHLPGWAWRRPGPELTCPFQAWALPGPRTGMANTAAEPMPGWVWAAAVSGIAGSRGVENGGGSRGMK